MTDIKSRGFDKDSEEQLNDHLAEQEDRVLGPSPKPSRSSEIEVAALRTEVDELRERVNQLKATTYGVRGAGKAEARQTWLSIAATIATTYLLGRLAKQIRLGPAGAVAVPMIAERIGRQLRPRQEIVP